MILPNFLSKLTGAKGQFKRFFILMALTPLALFAHPREPYSKYFIAIKKNEPGFIDHLDTFVPFLPPQGLLYADPMLFKHEGINYIFYENYDYKKGIIDFVTIDRDFNLSDPVTVMDFPEHLSFPSVFSDNGHIYMTPETIQSQEVGLYEALNFPHNWVKKRTLVKGCGYTDPILFFHNGYYWLFTAIDTHIMQIFFAPSLNAEFTPHPINKKRLQGRNAGRVYMSEGRLIRPVMDCSKVYGGAMILKEIITLTPTTFVERPLRRIEPTWAPGLNGTHTLNVNEDFVIYDGRRAIYAWQEPLYSKP